MAAAGLSREQAIHLMEGARDHKGQWPSTLFIPREDSSGQLGREAARQDIDVVRVPEEELLVFVEEARQGFSERFEEDL